MTHPFCSIQIYKNQEENLTSRIIWRLNLFTWMYKYKTCLINWITWKELFLKNSENSYLCFRLAVLHLVSNFFFSLSITVLFFVHIFRCYFIWHRWSSIFPSASIFHRRRSRVFIVNFEHISHFVLVFLLLTLSR